MIVAITLLAAVLFSAKFLGTEILPTLNEGSLGYCEMPMSTSLRESVKTTKLLKSTLETFPEVIGVLSQTGRSNDGTDPNGFGFVQFAVALKPKEEWTRKITMDQLIEEMDHKLKQFRGLPITIHSLFRIMSPKPLLVSRPKTASRSCDNSRP
jgi:cobalt-zinc-cadmium resistance protein CzcA